MALTDGLIDYELKNGLRVLLRPARFAPLVSVWAWYHVGSKNESPGLTGASHWVEHMNFKGTANIPKREIKGLIERQGGFWNGYTFVDQTTYMETLRREGLETALRLEAERMGGSLFDPDEVASERTVIISELRGNENDPAELLDRETVAAALRAHPYRWPVIGWQSDIEAMSRDELYLHYRRHYSPNNAALVVVGDFEEAEARRQIEKHYGPIERWSDGRRPVTTVEPPQRGERRVEVHRVGAAPLLQVCYRAPGFGDDDFFAMLLFDALLAGPGGINIFGGSGGIARSSRLYRELIDSGLAASARAYLVPTEHPYLYAVFAVLKDAEDFPAVENAVYQTVEDLIRRPVRKAELEKARAQLRSKLAFEQEGITNMGHQLGFFATIGSVERYESVLDRIAALSLDEVKEAGLKYLGADNRTVGRFWPERGGAGGPER